VKWGCNHRKKRKKDMKFSRSDPKGAIIRTTTGPWKNVKTKIRASNFDVTSTAYCRRMGRRGATAMLAKRGTFPEKSKQL